MRQRDLRGGYLVPAVMLAILVLSGIYIHLKSSGDLDRVRDSESTEQAVATPLPDTSPPMVSILSHSDRSTVSGNVRITATTFDNVGVIRVDFYKNGVLYSSDNTVPYTASWNTYLDSGQSSWSARAYDSAGNVGISRAVRLSVNNSIPVTPTVAVSTGPQTIPPALPTPSVPVQSQPSLPDRPTISFSVSNTNVPVNGSTTFSWSTADATTCTASGDWSGTKPTSGSQNTGSLNSNRTYRLTCTGPGGSRTSSLTIAVVQPQSPTQPQPPAPPSSPQDTTLPEIAIISPANDSNVSGNVTIVATASDNVGVTKVEFYRNGQLYSSLSNPPYQTSWNPSSGPYGKYLWTARAYDAAGNSRTSVVISLTAVDPNPVVEPPPLPPSSPVPAVSVTFSAVSTNIPFNTSTTLNWSSSGATTCTASGDWSGTKPTSGSQSTGNLTSNKQYILTCNNSQNSDQATVNISVEPEPIPQPSETLAAAVTAEVAALLAGKTPPSFSGSPPFPSSIVNIFGTNGRHNPNIWAAGIDLTCIPRNGSTNGVLVTPRDMIYAAHFGSSAPTFVDSGGTAHSRTTVATAVIPGTDILVSTLNADLPSGVRPCKLLPSNIRSYSPPPTGSLTQGNRYPMVFTNQDRTLLIGGVYGYGNSVSLGPAISSTFSGWSYPLRQFDSGSGVFLIVNGQLGLITNWHTTSFGPVHSDNISQINAAIAANGSPHSVSTIDLSEFQTF